MFSYSLHPMTIDRGIYASASTIKVEFEGLEPETLAFDEEGLVHIKVAPTSVKFTLYDPDGKVLETLQSQVDYSGLLDETDEIELPVYTPRDLIFRKGN
jgi:hypothetical protein